MVHVVSVMIILTLLLITSNGLIIYYLYNLEGETCKCVLDWRHNYLKYSSFILEVSLLILFFMFILKISNKYMLELIIFIILLITVNGFIFNDYIMYLEKSKCNCAIDKQKKLHTFMNYYSFICKWISIYLTIVGLLLVIFSIDYINKNKIKIF